MFEKEMEQIKERLLTVGINKDFSEEQIESIRGAYNRGIRGNNLRMIARPSFSPKIMDQMKEKMVPLFK